jgi:hypothetical protein
VTESADERGWRSLPAQIHVARGRLPPGRHRVTIETRAGALSTEVNISGSHAFVGLRLLRGTLFAMLPQGRGSVPPHSTPPEPVAAPAGRAFDADPAPAGSEGAVPAAN